MVHYSASIHIQNHVSPFSVIMFLCSKLCRSLLTTANQNKLQVVSLALIFTLTYHVMPKAEARPISETSIALPTPTFEGCFESGSLCHEVSILGSQFSSRITSAVSKVAGVLKRISYSTCFSLYELSAYVRGSISCSRTAGKRWLRHSLQYSERTKVHLWHAIHDLSKAVKTFDYEGVGKIAYAGLSEVGRNFVSACWWY